MNREHTQQKTYAQIIRVTSDVVVVREVDVIRAAINIRRRICRPHPSGITIPGVGTV